MKVEDTFNQEPPPEGNPFTGNAVLPGLLLRLLPPEYSLDVLHDLERFGEKVVSDLRPIAPLVHEPTLTQYDHWGRRIDTLQSSEGWRLLRAFFVRERILTDAYARRRGAFSRVLQFTKIMLLAGDGHVIICPLAMTDGAARAIELSGTPAMKRDYFQKLISDDPGEAYTSGQWMTEKPGGSDVSRTETVASSVPTLASDAGEAYELNGFKWFSSAAEGNMAVALARSEDPVTHPGSRGLSLFLVPLRTPTYPTPLSNGVRIHRLKDKFGTKAVPTAELGLDGTRAFLIGERGRGIPAIVPVLTLTRMHSAMSSIGYLQRALGIATGFAGVRTIMVAGTERTLRDTPLHVSSLARAALVYRALAHFAIHVILLVGKSECGASESEIARLRLLTPVLKAYAAENASQQIQACMAALGGQGYMEETGIGRLLRDCAVEGIWEGTAAVLSLDVMRASKGRDEPVKHFVSWAREVLHASASAFPTDDAAIQCLDQDVRGLPALFVSASSNPLLPRPLLDVLGHITAGVTLLEHATWAILQKRADSWTDAEAFRRWVLEERPRDCEALSRCDVSDRARADSALVFQTAKL